MSDFTYSSTFVIHDCPTCGVLFAITRDYDTRLRASGREFYCPNRHSLSYPGILPRQELKQALDDANQKIAKLNNVRAGLQARLDRAEMALQANNLLEKPEEPQEDNG